MCNSAASDKVLLKRLDDMEKLMKNVSINHELWSENVLGFFNLPKEYQMSLLRIKNDKIQAESK